MAAIGIDLGTTFSCVAAVVNGKVEVIPNKRGNYITPSCVAFTKHGVLIGEDAKANLSEDPSNVLLNVKRIIGLRKDDPVFKAQTKNLPYKITEKDGEIAIQICIDGKMEYHYPEEISGQVLSEMKKIAEDYLGTEVVNAVITVPARFNDLQRKKTREAADYARLNVLRLLHEPTAAALAYGLQNEARDDLHVLVYDLGGGTFDVNILTMKEEEFKILATAGDTHLGGEDFDNRMVRACIKVFAETEGVDLGNDLTATYRLRKECEKTKIALSSVLHDEVKIEKIFEGKNFKKTFSRAKFEYMNEDSFGATMEAVDSALRDANLDKKQIDEIVLVGGSTRIPHVQQMLKQYFAKEQLCMSLDADQAIAYGAAICAAQMTGDVTIQLQNFRIRDVIPFSLGVKTDGGVMSVVIKRNTQFPTSQDGSYTTVDDNQTSIRVEVYEGDSARVALNNRLGSFPLDGIPPQLAGEPKIKIQFEIDINGMLQVSALDKATGKKNNIVIEWRKQSQNAEPAKLEILRECTKLPMDEDNYVIMSPGGTPPWPTQNYDSTSIEFKSKLEKLMKNRNISDT